jgi:hypothetical protein
MTDRGAVAAETLVKVVFALAVVWLVLDVYTMFAEDTMFGPLKLLVGVLVVVLTFLSTIDVV